MPSHTCDLQQGAEGWFRVGDLPPARIGPGARDTQRGTLGTVMVAGGELSGKPWPPRITLCSCAQCLGGAAASSLGLGHTDGEAESGRWCRFLALHGRRPAWGPKPDLSCVWATASGAQGLLPAWGCLRSTQSPGSNLGLPRAKPVHQPPELTDQLVPGLG